MPDSRPDHRPGHRPDARRRSPFTSGLLVSGLARAAADDAVPDVAVGLRRAILAGDEPPGTLIPIDAVAAFFGVSPIPVREALKELLGEGLVEHRPRLGYRVAKLSFAEFRELYDVRQALESAALAPAVRRAGPADDDLLRSTQAAMATALGDGDERGYHRHSRSFHLALIRPSGMQRLVHMYEAAWNLTEPVRPMARVPAAGRAGLAHDHDAMLAAFIARDPGLLASRSQEHFEHLKAAIEAIGDDADTFRSTPG